MFHAELAVVDVVVVGVTLLAGRFEHMVDLQRLPGGGGQVRVRVRVGIRVRVPGLDLRCLLNLVMVP